MDPQGNAPERPPSPGAEPWPPMMLPRSAYRPPPPPPGASPTEVWIRRALLAALVGAAAFLGWRAFGPPAVKRVGPRPAQGSTVVVLLHGYGAPADDLVGLADEISSALPGVSFLVPSGPHRVDVGGRSWIPSYSAPSRAEYAVRLAVEIERTSRQVWKVIADARGRGARCEDIFIGGFSQGGRMAAEVALRAPEGCALGGVMVLSGGGMNEVELPASQGKPRMRVLVAHGTADRVVSAARGRAIAEHFARGGHEVRWLEFSGPHTIPPAVREAIPAFVKGQEVGVHHDGG